uniref:Uncharacterized protein n=1 Tax=Oryza meridionalis TaxID=40149 RepID=A0A0E0DPJ2_9ORYZ
MSILLMMECAMADRCKQRRAGLDSVELQAGGRGGGNEQQLRDLRAGARYVNGRSTGRKVMDFYKMIDLYGQRIWLPLTIATNSSDLLVYILVNSDELMNQGIQDINYVIQIPQRIIMGH